mmetsp:Transcript_3338/g.6082  ORF Transcript_3338/g.6082 Transcript_3338/m.6082 type:complete len:104 (+) Transcript_3338:51-362(+)
MTGSIVSCSYPNHTIRVRWMMEPTPPCSHMRHTIDGNAMDIAAPSSHAPIGTVIQSDAAMEAMMMMEWQHDGLHRVMLLSKPYHPGAMDDGTDTAMLSYAPYH